MKQAGSNRCPTEKISHRVLYVLTAVIAIIFGLFYFVDYSQPFEDNPDYNAPRFTGMLVSFTVAFFVVSAIVGFVSLVIGLRKRGKEGAVVNGVRSARITIIISVFTTMLLAVCFALGTTDPIVIDGEPYADVFLLKVADMFVYSIIVMLLLGVGAVVYGATRYFRKNDS